MKQFRNIVTAVVCLITLGIYISVPAQVTQLGLKAALIEKFSRFIDWPVSVLDPEDDKPFIIALIGYTQLHSSLQKMAAVKKIKGKSVEIRQLLDIDQIHDCHVLFIAGSERKNLTRILALTKNKPILTIGDTAGFAEQCVLINFYEQDGFIRFQINISAIPASQLFFRSKLLRLAQIIPTECS